MTVSLTELFDTQQTMFDLRYYNDVCRLVKAIIEVKNYAQKIKESLRITDYCTSNITAKNAIQKKDEFFTRYQGMLDIHNSYVNWYFQTPLSP
jgi:hypothetical protein